MLDSDTPRVCWGSLRRGQAEEHVPTRRTVSGGFGDREDLLWRGDAIAVHAKQLEMEDHLLMGRFAPLRVEEVEIEVRERLNLRIVRGPTHFPHSVKTTFIFNYYQINRSISNGCCRNGTVNGPPVLSSPLPWMLVDVRTRWENSRPYSKQVDCY